MDFKVFQNLKNMKRGHLSPFYNHLSRKRSKLVYLRCKFVSKEGTLFLELVSKTIKLHEIFLSVSVGVHYSYIFIEKVIYILYLR